MGLDQYLYAKKYVSKTEWNQPAENEMHDNIMSALDVPSLHNLTSETQDFTSLEVSVKVMQWRKSNQIHGWFVSNVQNGEDDCKDYYVGREDLTQLLDLCKQVLADNTLAEELLPNTSGFFFGTQEYDEWYVMDVKYTADTLERLLDDPAIENWSFSYTSSW
jgi:hypothetical protein